MAQYVAHVNCPRCGSIVEAVCPVFDETPTNVIVDGEYLWRTGKRSEIGCPNCGSRIYVIWYFD